MILMDIVDSLSFRAIPMSDFNVGVIHYAKTADLKRRLVGQLLETPLAHLAGTCDTAPLGPARSEIYP